MLRFCVKVKLKHMLMEDWTERTIVKEGLIRAAKGGWINLMKKYKDLLLIFATNALDRDWETLA